MPLSRNRTLKPPLSAWTTTQLDTSAVALHLATAQMTTEPLSLTPTQPLSLCTMPTQLPVVPSDDAASLASHDSDETVATEGRNDDTPSATRFDPIHETMDAAATDFNDPMESIPFIADSTDEWPQHLKSDPVVAGFIEAIRNASIHAKRLEAHIGLASWQGPRKGETTGPAARVKRARPE